MIAACDWQNPDPAECLGELAGGVVGGVAGNAWESVCRSFAEAAVFMLKGFADLFVAFPAPDLASVDGPHAISMGIAAFIAAILVLGQVIRTATTHDGSAVATALVGLGKAVIVILAINWIARAALMASDDIARSIIKQSLGDEEQLKAWLTGLFQFQAATSPQGPGTPASMVLILGLLGIVLTGVLWFEMLLRNAAVLILIATAPIAAVGSISESTKSWWTKLCAAVVQLIALKPVIALVFAVGFGITKGSGGSDVPGDIATILSGMLVLLLAVVAWPVIAKFFTFASVSFAGGGLAGMLGFAAGRANSGRSQSGGTVGVKPSQLAQATEARTMATSGAKASGAAEAASVMGAKSAAGGAGASGGAAAGAAGAGAVAGPLAVAAVGVDVAQRGVNALSARMEQMASHADLDGANPHSRPAGHPQYDGKWSSPSNHSQPEQAGASSSGSRTTDAPAAQAGVMPETRTSDPIPVDVPPPPPAPPTPSPAYTSSIEETGR